MHYYQFHIADYRKDTAHLTPLEHYIYRWLIDQYYLSEQPLNGRSTALCRLMGLDQKEAKIVTNILCEFFKSVPWPEDSEYFNESDPNETMCWVHPRIDQEILDYKEYLEKQSKAGKASAKKRAEHKNKVIQSILTKSNQRSTVVQPTINHKPLTINHNKKHMVENFNVFWQAYPKKVGKQKCQAIWMRKNPPLDLCMQALQWQIKSDNWVSGFIPNPETYLNQGRWEDEPPKKLGFLNDVY